MSIFARPVSEIYTPDAPNSLTDVPAEDRYAEWGYTLAYETEPEQAAVWRNIAVFRILEKGMTEPVYVTKPDSHATFEVTVLSGEGKLIRAFSSGAVEEAPLEEGGVVTIKPGQ